MKIKILRNIYQGDNVLALTSRSKTISSIAGEWLQVIGPIFSGYGPWYREEFEGKLVFFGLIRSTPTPRSVFLVAFYVKQELFWLGLYLRGSM